MAKKAKPKDEDDLVEEAGEQAAGIGHNSVSKKELMGFIHECEKLIDQRDVINEAIKDALTVAKTKGYDVRTIREAMKLRAMDKDKFEEREQLRDLYLQAVGLL